MRLKKQTNKQTALQKDFYVIVVSGKEGLSYQGTISQWDIQGLEQPMGYSLVLAYLEKL